MTARHFLISPSDTLFLRDGRPFNQDDEGLAEARSIFPPYPDTLVGAFRAAAARRAGWRDDGNWKGRSGPDGQAFEAVLGDGLDTLGALSFGPPVLLRRWRDGYERLFPPPLSLLRRAEDGTLHLLRPDEKTPLFF